MEKSFEQKHAKDAKGKNEGRVRLVPTGKSAVARPLVRLDCYPLFSRFVFLRDLCVLLFESPLHFIRELNFK